MHRTVAYPPDGRRVHVSPAAVAATWEAQFTRIPPQFAVASAEHESEHTINEIDHEPPDEHGVSYVSKGIFQLSDGEAAHVGHADADLLTLEGATLVFALLQEERLALILSAAGLSMPIPDVWAYLAMSHNFGLTATRKTIIQHGLNWPAWCARNPTLTNAIAYFSDAITGGARWPEALAAA